MKPVAEALLFASDEPLPAARLAQILGKSADAKSARKLVEELNAEYTAQGRAFEVVEIAGGFQLLTRPEFKDWVAELHRHRRQDKLTPSAVETLAIVAYKQPIQRATVDDIRGVQSGPLLRSLLERGLIKVAGRQNVPGRPILYGTSRLFLQHFGLKSLKDLPRVAELSPP
jgi:segregation and condensation protein B